MIIKTRSILLTAIILKPDVLAVVLISSHFLSMVAGHRQSPLRGGVPPRGAGGGVLKSKQEARLDSSQNFLPPNPFIKTKTGPFLNLSPFQADCWLPN